MSSAESCLCLFLNSVPCIVSPVSQSPSPVPVPCALYLVLCTISCFVSYPALPFGFLPRGAGAPPSSSSPLSETSPPKIWSENNRKISITIEICMRIDFPLKKFLKESQPCSALSYLTLPYPALLCLSLPYPTLRLFLLLIQAVSCPIPLCPMLPLFCVLYVMCQFLYWNK